MIESSCHCGAVNLRVNAALPEYLLSCNCSICRRLGALMAYYKEDQVEIKAEESSLRKYTWGDKMLAFVTCNTCGSFSHWEGLPNEKKENRIGLNARLFNNVDISDLRVRRFDGADTWKFLDD